MKIKTTLLLLFGFYSFWGMSQLSAEIDSLFNDPTKVYAKNIIGDWRTSDSIPMKIRIEEKQHEVVLTITDNRTYSFQKNSAGIMGVRGLQMQWPPQYCHISWANGKELMLTLFTLSTLQANYHFTLIRVPEQD